LSEDQALVFLNLDLSLNLPESWWTFSASCYDFFLSAEGGETGGLFCGAAMAGAVDVEAGVNSCDFLTSIILVRIVASLVKGEFG
jgi:hypothetical protein